MYRFTVYADSTEMAMLAEYAGVDCDIDSDETDSGAPSSFVRIPNEAHARQFVTILHSAGYRWHIGSEKSIYSDPTFAQADGNINRDKRSAARK